MIHIEIWSDVMCPFCYIGKRRLEKALHELNLTHQVKIEWKSFELNPYLVTNPSQDIYSYLSENKGISLQEAKNMSKHVIASAQQEGITFNMDHVIPANSNKAHQLLHFAKSKGGIIQNALKELLFKAYFEEGKNTDDESVLLQLAEQVGLLPEEVKSIFSSNQFKHEVAEDIALAQQFGVRGVPFFVFNRKYAISGAQPLNHFKETLTEISKEFA